MGSRRMAEQHDSMLRELNEERAAALLRISRTLESMITQLHEARAALAAATGDQHERQLAAYRDLRREALRYRWYLEVQRESVGLRHHECLDEFYRIPPADPSSIRCSTSPGASIRSNDCSPS